MTQAVLFSLLFGVFALSAQAQSVTPRGVQIVNWDLSGDGCDMDNVTVSLSPEAQDLSFLFDSYVAEIGPASENPLRKELVKNCRITIDLDVPQGWQMAFKSVDYRGYASLPQSGSSAFHRLSVLPQGAPIVSLREVSMVGPMNDDYYLKAVISPARLTWSQCMSGRTQIQIYSQLGVRLNQRAPALRVDEALTIVLDSSDLSVKQNLGVEWRTCGSNVQPAPPVVTPAPPGRPAPPPRPPRYR